MSDQVAPDVLMNSVLGKVADVLLNGDGTVVPRSDDHYLAFLSPGTPLLPDTFDYALEGFGGVVRRNANGDATKALGPQEGDGGQPVVDASALAADARRKYMSAEAVSALCDLVPDTSAIIESNRINTWQPETRISHAYAMALQFSKVIDSEPDAETKRKLERWMGLLQETVVEKDLVTEEEVEVVRETELVRKYREKMLAYIGEVLAYNNARISALSGQDEAAVHNFAINGPVLQMRVRAAENDWITNGYRDTYDRIAAAIAAVEGRSFALLKQRYREAFDRSVLTNPNSGANFSYMAPLPADFARGGSGWSEFHFNHGSYRSDFKFSSSRTSGGGGLNLGLYRVGGSGSVSRENENKKIDAKRFSLRMKMARVPIYRPGINLAFLQSGYWKFDPSDPIHKNTMISDGGSPPDGLMPSVTTDMILVRDLHMDFGELNAEFERKSRSTSGSVGFGYGPFHVGGGHTNRREERTQDVEWTSQGLHIRGMQLIGFMCYMLPKSPNPSPDVTSWI